MFQGTGRKRIKNIMKAYTQGTMTVNSLVVYTSKGCSLPIYILINKTNKWSWYVSFLVSTLDQTIWYEELYKKSAYFCCCNMATNNLRHMPICHEIWKVLHSRHTLSTGWSSWVGTSDNTTINQIQQIHRENKPVSSFIHFSPNKQYL